MTDVRGQRSDNRQGARDGFPDGRWTTALLGRGTIEKTVWSKEKK